MSRIKVPAVFLAALLFAAPVAAHPAEIENIPSDRYFEVTLNEIHQAKSSIRLTMYLIALPPKREGSKAYRLADGLAEARERGVEVKVVLDGPSAFGDPADKNDRAVRYLRERGVEVFYDDENRLTHAKALVIDGETVILGSTNWSEAALTRNVEANVLIRSKELAGEIVAGLEEFPVHAPAGGGAEGVRVPRAFLEDPKFLGRMVTDDDPRAFDGYLYLLKLHNEKIGEDRVTPDREALLKVLPPKPLRRLRKKYGLIQYSWEKGADPVISLKPVGDGAETTELPVSYWEWGWDRKLSFSGKVMLLLSRVYSDASPMAPTWFRSRADIAKEHGISTTFVYTGLMELRRFNLIEVKPGALNPAAYSQRDANHYTPNPLYDPAKLKVAFKELEGRYGKEAVRKAAGYAALVYEDSDLDAVERLIVFEKEFGATVVERAVRKVAAMSGSNPKKTMGYLIRTIQGMGKEPA